MAISNKSSGGRSSGASSLGLWTLKLQKLEYDSSLVTQKCNREKDVAAITTGACVSFDQVYKFAHENGRHTPWRIWPYRRRVPDGLNACFGLRTAWFSR